MRNKILAAASTAGIVLNGLILVRAGLFSGPIANGRNAIAVAGNVALALMTPRTASADGRHDETGTSEKPPIAEIPAPPAAPAAVDAPLAKEPKDAGDAPTATPKKAAEHSTGGSCPEHMILVEGDYCPDVRHDCKHWLEEKGKYAYYRCEEYTKATCLSKEKEHKRFCMDRDEWVPHGEKLPANTKSWTDAQRTCESEGKRVCLESEWNFACEGEEMRPYPYGWKRDPDACNADLTDIYRSDGKLRDLRVSADDKPRCVSPFGVHNLTGNLEEWTTIDASARINYPRPAMKGAYWQPSRNHCRAAQTAHDRYYKGTETGFRCCSDPK